jgi:hypothetical protein
MKFATEVFKKITTSLRHLFSNRDEMGLGVNAILKRFNLLEEGKKLGLLGLPPFHSKELSSIELEVLRYIEHDREKMKQGYLSDIEKIDACIAETQTHQHDLKTGLLTTDFERQALVIFNQQNAWLDKLASSAKRKLQELETFKANNSLTRDASYPDGSAVFFRYALLVLLIAFEGVFNASFFAEGLSTGLLGGFFYAVTLAGINVVTAFILGKSAVRWAFHIKPVPKTFGLLALIATLCIIATNAIAIGHLRSAILLESTNPTQDAFYTMLANPIGFNDLMAWILFLVTIGFGIAAMTDGLFLDDLYPGYGNVYRRTKLAVDEFEEEFEEVRAEFEALDTEIRKANELLIRFSQQLDDKKAIYKSWTQKLSESEVILYATLRAFRSENAKHRNDALLPSYFDTLPTLKEVSLPKPNVQQHEAELQEMQRQVKQIETSLPSRKARIHELFDSHIQQLSFLK